MAIYFRGEPYREHYGLTESPYHAIKTRVKVVCIILGILSYIALIMIADDGLSSSGYIEIAPVFIAGVSIALTYLTRFLCWIIYLLSHPICRLKAWVSDLSVQGGIWFWGAVPSAVLLTVYLLLYFFCEGIDRDVISCIFINCIAIFLSFAAFLSMSAVACDTPIGRTALKKIQNKGFTAFHAGIGFSFLAVTLRAISSFIIFFFFRTKLETLTPLFNIFAICLAAICIVIGVGIYVGCRLKILQIKNLSNVSLSTILEKTDELLWVKRSEAHDFLAIRYGKKYTKCSSIIWELIDEKLPSLVDTQKISNTEFPILLQINTGDDCDYIYITKNPDVLSEGWELTKLHVMPHVVEIVNDFTRVDAETLYHTFEEARNHPNHDFSDLRGRSIWFFSTHEYLEKILDIMINNGDIIREQGVSEDGQRLMEIFTTSNKEVIREAHQKAIDDAEEID